MLLKMRDEEGITLGDDEQVVESMGEWWAT
jgi:hypothetical protein